MRLHLLVLSFAFCCTPAAAAETRVQGELALQTRLFLHEGEAGEARWHPSVAFFAEVTAQLTDDDQVVFSPFLRWDAQDAERTHADVRELYWSHVAEAWELSLGVRQVFWGVTEFHHLVDIINATDQVENVDDEDRLGQPMVQLSLVRDWGIVDVFLLAGARERTFAGREGRLRLPVKIDAKHPTYASGAQDRRLDGAIRWSHHWGGIDIGVHHFSGTSRDPLLLPNGSRLTPHYTVIDQTGVDAQWLRGDWALKLEALSRSGEGERFSAAVAGFERTLVGVMNSALDVGVVFEYAFDDRDEKAHSTLFEHDVALGARLTWNDAADTNALIGLVWDTDTGERVFSVEAHRQLGNEWALNVEARLFSGSKRWPADDPFAALSSGDHRAGFLEREDFLQIELKRFF